MTTPGTLSAQKQALLQRWAKGRQASPGVSRSAGPGGPQPLSHAQERMWFLQQLDPAQGSYNMPVARRLRGVLDTAALYRALRKVVRRHAVLRSRFVLREGVPQQEPIAGLELEVELRDLAALPTGERDTALQALAQAEARQPFDMAQDPPLRARLLRCGAEDHVLLLTLHHIAADGWSIGVLRARW